MSNNIQSINVCVSFAFEIFLFISSRSFVKYSSGVGFFLNDGLIDNNKFYNQYGGTVATYQGAYFEMNDGEISNNHAIEGTVYIGWGYHHEIKANMYAEMIMNGGSIINNKSDSFGGGIGSNGGIHIGNPSEEWKLKVIKECF